MEWTIQMQDTSFSGPGGCPQTTQIDPVFELLALPRRRTGGKFGRVLELELLLVALNF
jgi:hypothetical protein